MSRPEKESPEGQTGDSSGEPTLFEQSLSQSVEQEEPEEEESRLWPAQDRFPLNEGDNEVGDAVAKSFMASSSFLVVTAFTSLEHLLSFFGQHEIRARSVDIVLGSEPSMGPEGFYEGIRPIARQARDYWLERGVSVLTGGGALRLIRAMEEGKVRFHAAENLHAKIYLGDESATWVEQLLPSRSQAAA
jgi:hypothetical protein